MTIAVSKSSGATSITGPDISRYRMVTLLRALKLEVAGMTRRGRSAGAIIKDEFGLKGSKAVLYQRFEQYLKDQGVLDDKGRFIATEVKIEP